MMTKHLVMNKGERKYFSSVKHLESFYLLLSHPLSLGFYAYILNKGPISVIFLCRKMPFKSESHWRRDRGASLRSSSAVPTPKSTGWECILGQLWRQALGSDTVQSVISLGPDRDTKVWLRLVWSSFKSTWILVRLLALTEK